MAKTSPYFLVFFAAIAFSGSEVAYGEDEFYLGRN